MSQMCFKQNCDDWLLMGINRLSDNRLAGNGD
ncbi:hypothetical protein [Proteus phage RP7]|nr:hypothetical protein [Proteus phage RP7]